MTALEEMVEKDSIFQTIDLFIDQLSIRSIGVKSNDELDYRKLGSIYLSLATYPNTIIDAKVFVEKYKTQVLTPDQVEIIMSETLKI